MICHKCKKELANLIRMTRIAAFERAAILVMISFTEETKKNTIVQFLKKHAERLREERGVS